MAFGEAPKCGVCGFQRPLSGPVGLRLVQTVGRWPLFYESKVLDLYTVCWNTRLQLQRNNTAVVALHLPRPVVCYRRVFLVCRWNKLWRRLRDPATCKVPPPSRGFTFHLIDAGSPRTGDADATRSEPFGDDAPYIRDRRLHINRKCTFAALPARFLSTPPWMKVRTKRGKIMSPVVSFPAELSFVSRHSGALLLSLVETQRGFTQP